MVMLLMMVRIIGWRGRLRHLTCADGADEDKEGNYHDPNLSQFLFTEVV